MTSTAHPPRAEGTGRRHLDPPTEPIAVQHVGGGKPAQGAGTARPLVVAGVVALILAVGGFGWVLSGGGAVRPCSASPGSLLAGFDDVVGPTVRDFPGSAGRPGTQLCLYSTVPSATRQQVETGVMLIRMPRTSVDTDPSAARLWRMDPAERISSSSQAYPLELIHSGVTAVVTPSEGGADVVSATCVAGDDYWSVSVSSRGRDDSVGLDSLFDAMDCEPVDILR